MFNRQVDLGSMTEWSQKYTDSQAVSRYTLGSFPLYLSKVLGVLSFGLFVSFSVAFIIAILASANLQLGLFFSLLALPIVVAQLIIVFVLSLFSHRMSLALSSVIFVLYSAMTGLTLGLIMAGYDLIGILLALGTTFIVFGLMAFIGYTTKVDLSRLGVIAFVGLIGLIIATLLNFFVSLISPGAASVIDLIITYFGVFVFLGLTAWDTQKLKNLALQATDQSSLNRLVVYGALSLYLDFINLFIYTLRIFGGRQR